VSLHVSWPGLGVSASLHPACPCRDSSKAQPGLASSVFNINLFLAPPLSTTTPSAAPRPPLCVNLYPGLATALCFGVGQFPDLAASALASMRVFLCIGFSPILLLLSSLFYRLPNQIRVKRRESSSLHTQIASHHTHNWCRLPNQTKWGCSAYQHSTA
jgi:hypothetical protein